MGASEKETIKCFPEPHGKPRPCRLPYHHGHSYCCHYHFIPHIAPIPTPAKSGLCHHEQGAPGSLLVTQTTPIPDIGRSEQEVPNLPQVRAPVLLTSRVRAGATFWHKGRAVCASGLAAARGQPFCHKEAFEQLLVGAALSLKAPGSHKPCLSGSPLAGETAAVGAGSRPCPAPGHTVTPASSASP